MKKIIPFAFFAFLCGQLFGQTNIIRVPVADYGFGITRNIPVTLTLDDPNPRTAIAPDGTTYFILQNPIQHYTQTNGFAYFTNIAWGHYHFDIGANPATEFSITVTTNTIGAVDSTTLYGTSDAIPSTTNYYYSAQQIDELLFGIELLMHEAFVASATNSINATNDENGNRISMTYLTASKAGTNTTVTISNGVAIISADVSEAAIIGVSNAVIWLCNSNAAANYLPTSIYNAGWGHFLTNVLGTFVQQNGIFTNATIVSATSAAPLTVIPNSTFDGARPLEFGSHAHDGVDTLFSAAGLGIVLYGLAGDGGGIFSSNATPILTWTDNGNLFWMGNPIDPAITDLIGAEEHFAQTNLISASVISTNGSSAGQVLTSVGGQTVWTNGSAVISFTSSLVAINDSSTAYVVNHGLGHVPKFYSVDFVCINDDTALNMTAGQHVQVDKLNAEDQFPIIYADDTMIEVDFPEPLSGNEGSMGMIPRGGGPGVNIDDWSNFKIEFHAQ